MKWMDILVPPTLSDFRCSADRYFLSESLFALISLVVARCTHLLKLKIPTWPYHIEGERCWDLLLSQEIPQHLESLSLHPPICDNKVFSWAANASGLRHLSIKLSEFSSFLIPRGSFQELRSLEVISSGANALMHLWSTPIVSYLICATIIVEDEIVEDTEIGPLYAHVVANSPLLNEFNYKGRHWISLEDLDKLRPLPLHSLRMPDVGFVPASQSIFQTIASFWPNLERLDLKETPIALDDLVCISRYLPELRDLVVQFPGGYPPEAICAPRLSPEELDTQRAVWLSHSFLLSTPPTCPPIHNYSSSNLRDIAA